MKTFFKTFIVTLIIFTCIFIPVFAWWEGIQDNTIFSSEVNLEEDMPVMIDESNEFYKEFTNSNRVNILLMGINSNLADTIMLVSYDIDSSRIDLISIPRDTYYPRAGHNAPTSKKINCAFNDGGPLELAQSVSDLLMGIPINCYMKIDYKGVANIVDSMGGVPVTVPFHMKYTDVWDTPPLYIDIPEGYTVLDGETAIKYLRFRKGDKGYPGYKEGDIGRIAAQQEFMKSAFKQALGLNIIKVINSVIKNVESDITVNIAVAMAKKATNLSSENLHTYVLPGEARNGEANLSFVFPYKKGIEQMLTEIYSSNTVDAEGDTESNGSDTTN